MMKNDTCTPAPPITWFGQAQSKKLADGFKFTEGPVWHPDKYFLFSDTPANCIYQLFMDGTIRVYLHNSGLNHKNLENLSDQVGSNGLVLDAVNNLYICQHGNHAIAVLNKRKELSVLVNHYKGMPFNSPNDITLRSDGILYFTDPPYGLAGQVLHPTSFQPHAGIYKYDGDEVVLLGTELNYPNGLCFSPDERFLYVSTNHPDEKKILQYSVEAEGTLNYKGVLLKENADGMTVDAGGNIYLAVKEGILMVSPQGKKVALVSMHDTPTNLAWGEDEAVLFVTAASAIYFIEK